MEQHMDILKQDSLETLLADSHEVCVSLFMPTSRTDSNQNIIRLKNLLNEAETQLEAKGLSPQQIETLLAAGYRIWEREAWRHLSDGLSIFLTEDLLFSYRLPLDFEELVVIGERFHVRPLLPLVNRNDYFFILSLSQSNVNLYYSTPLHISPVMLTDIPHSLAEALQYDEKERQTQYHGGETASTGGQQSPVYHGHGVGSDEETQDLLRYFRKVDNGLCDLLAGEQTPLVLAGLETVQGLYRQANHYEYLEDQGIVGNPDDMSTETLHQRGWEIMRPSFETDRQAAIDRYHQQSNNDGNRIAQHLNTVIPAAYYKRIDTLFVARDVHKWGSFVPEHNTIKLDDAQQADNEDLLNFAVLHTLLNGGAVYDLPADQMPEQGAEVTAILRF